MRSRFMVAAGVAAAASPAFGQLERVVAFSNLHRPVGIAQAPGEVNRMFVVEQRGVGTTVARSLATTTGRISLWNTTNNTEIGTVLTIANLNNSNEEGLLGLAFHPNYATNGFAYVNVTVGGTAARRTEIRRYTRSAAGPNTFDASSMLVVMTIPQDFSNHNGGTIRFGEDGFLYVGMGDGGSGNDPNNRAQDINSLLGKMVRIDVNGDDFPLDAANNYRIPAGNPLAGATPGRDEIWAIGLRNPWKWDIDTRARNGFNGMVIADVGQGAREESSYASMTEANLNYGWRVWEGTLNTGLSGNPTLANRRDPFFQYTYSSVGFSTTGAAIYRGTGLGVEFWGDYLVGDYVSDWLTAIPMNFDYESGALLNTLLSYTTSTFTPRFTMNNPSAFELDANGELWYCELNTASLGAIYRIQRTAAAGGVSRALSGNISLGDYAGPFGPTGVPVEIRMNSNPSNVITLQVGLSPNGTLRIPVPTGAGRVSVNYGSWLRKTVPFDSTAANVAGVNLALVNGDVDNSGEVDAADIDVVIGNFGLGIGDAGYPANRNSDLDRSGEVDAADIDVVIANFGAGDDAP